MLFPCPSDKMEALLLLLVFITVPGYSHVSQPKAIVTQIAGLDRDHQYELEDYFVSAEERGNGGHVAAGLTERTEEEQGSDGLSPETNPVRKIGEDGLKIEDFMDRNKGYEKGRTAEIFSKSTIPGEGTKREEYSVADMVEDIDMEVVAEKREEGLNLVPKSKREENIMVKTIHSDNTNNWKMVRSQNTKTQEEAEYDETDVKLPKSDRMEQLRREIVEEERESKLVAGISLYGETGGDTRDDKIIIAEQEGNEEKAEEGEDSKKHNELVERGNEDHILVPLLRTSSAHIGKESEIVATIQIITQSQNPPSSPPPHHNDPPPFTFTTTHVVSPLSFLPPSPFAKVSAQFFPPAVTISNPTVSTVDPGDVRSVSLLEDLLTEELQRPGQNPKQNQLEVKASPNLEDGNIWSKPAHKEHQTVHKAQEINTAVHPQIEFTPSVQAASPKPKESKIISKDLTTKEPNTRPKSNKNTSTTKPLKLTHKTNMTQPRGDPVSDKVVENDTELAVRQNKASLPQPRVTKPPARPQPAPAKTPSTRPTKINRNSKNKTVRKSKDKKRKKDNKTQKPPETKKNVTTPTHFPFFLDNYCPPECACYGRVVQCSDKGVDKVPYGIPYNARYILLMNNYINSIQLDLLKEYVSMEFLVLSNNRLTDGAIEGALEGIPALKRLYLDRNLLVSVPADLPLSLEELRLDNNHLGVMSEAAWARCPGLLVLSLSNNSLGNGSESLPNAVLSPLRKLRTLNVNHNQLTMVPRVLPLSIKELYLKGNLIEQFRGGAFNGISELVVLDLSANRLTNKGLLRESLLNTTHLESLNLEGNRLKQVPRHLPCSLKTLNLEGNLIASIKKAAFSTLKNLEHLGLARNKIFKVALGAFRTLPVLHQLDLCHNTLRQVPRHLPQGLHTVALTHNRIQSVPRDAFCWGDNSLSPSRLIQVQLEHNLIDMGKLDAQAFRCLRGFQVVHFY
uniref:Wu:fc23c09 n=1 Tax=Scophthalmus maximus TaxID=52904 RepID=A0A8D2ZKI6_SCOMX